MVESPRNYARLAARQLVTMDVRGCVAILMAPEFELKANAKAFAVTLFTRKR